MNLLRKVTALCAYGLASAVVPFALWAPGTASAQEGSASAFLDEIVTTARKRSSAEAVQDVQQLLDTGNEDLIHKKARAYLEKADVAAAWKLLLAADGKSR